MKRRIEKRKIRSKKKFGIVKFRDVWRLNRTMEEITIKRVEREYKESEIWRK